MFRGLRKACSQASTITGLTSSYVDWAACHAGRPRTALDRVFPMAYTANKPGPAALRAAEEFWKKQGHFLNGKHFAACFFGFLGRQFDLETVIGAARRLKSHPANFRFVLCGTGDQRGFYQRLDRDCPNILFPGWVGMAEIWSLMRLSSLGLAPYRNTCNFVGSIPNKPIEYLSAGLPIVSSLNGVLQGLLDLHQCGVTYEEGNPESLAAALVSLNADRERLRKMSANARQLYELHSAIGSTVFTPTAPACPDT
jgi:glycosyltransferase involved in cell wall biosynthesis